MSLQRRLTLFFILIVILPLAVAGFVVQRVVVGEIEQRARLSLGPALNSATTLYNDRIASLDDHVRSSVGFSRFVRLLETGRAENIDEFLKTQLVDERGLDFLVALDPNGRRVGYADRKGTFEDGIEQPGPDEIVASEAGTGPGFVRTAELPVKVAGGGIVGSVVGGFWLDGDLLVPSSQEGVELAFVAGDRVIASTGDLNEPVAVSPRFGDSFKADIGEESLVEARNLAGDMALISWTPEGPIADRSREVLTWMIALLVIAVLATVVLAKRLARLTTEDLEELTRGARAIAQGHFDTRIEVRSKDEVGMLAEVFNDMTQQLSETYGELSEKRDQLQRAVRRVGETLRSTHDMKQILETILNTAGDAVDADAAILWRFSHTRSELYPAMARGVEIDEMELLKVGEGVVGLVAERGVQVVLPDPSGEPRLSPIEPSFPVLIAVPLYAADRIAAVLVMCREDATRPFSMEDRNAVRFLADQGAVALENVTLHEETQRLSLTDGLTGSYNRRYLMMQFRQVLATALRFERPFSVLMLDLDHFKVVNDTYGHQRGDEVLIEFSQRVLRLLREVDTFARYGGEEFVCLLSETNVHGAVTTAEKIVESIRSDVFGSPGEAPIELTVSIGVAAYPDHGDSWRSLLQAADDALYQAKQEGRDRVCIAGGQTPPPLKLAK